MRVEAQAADAPEQPADLELIATPGEQQQELVDVEGGIDPLAAGRGGQSCHHGDEPRRDDLCRPGPVSCPERQVARERLVGDVDPLHADEVAVAEAPRRAEPEPRPAHQDRHRDRPRGGDHEQEAAEDGARARRTAQVVSAAAAAPRHLLEVQLQHGEGDAVMRARERVVGFDHVGGGDEPRVSAAPPARRRRRRGG